MLSHRTLVYLSYDIVTGFVSRDKPDDQVWIALYCFDYFCSTDSLRFKTFILLPDVNLPLSQLAPGVFVSVDLINDFYVSNITVI